MTTDEVMRLLLQIRRRGSDAALAQGLIDVLATVPRVAEIIDAAPALTRWRNKPGWPTLGHLRKLAFVALAEVAVTVEHAGDSETMLARLCSGVRRRIPQIVAGEESDPVNSALKAASQQYEEGARLALQHGEAVLDDSIAAVAGVRGGRVREWRQARAVYHTHIRHIYDAERDEWGRIVTPKRRPRSSDE